MKIISIIILLFTALSTVHADEVKPVDQLPLVEIKGDVISYSGPINPAGNKNVIPLIETGLYKTLRINSKGGYIVDAILFGSKIFDFGLNVEVIELCNSSCANYIFPAGKTKKIADGAFVIWHGDARQSNFVKELQDLETLEMETGYASMQKRDQSRIDYLRHSIKEQDALYTKIGMNGRLARLGHDLEKAVWVWTIPAHVMAAFGLKNIDAPSDYGSKAYCNLWLKKHYANPTAQCLYLSNEEVDLWKLKNK